ncbi:pilus assembly protein [Serinibacter salmoneus]|uniref:TadE-like protein n=1 Tax=Serinibacter salmoneus TaxID=556530 RepID=A0A2A9D015_9MICO|nr:pilus assembly protein [Serinibacter salmoneus]PFG19190.1 hypothetical protein ATL40_0747 [Serinibacter salmoneus]
MRTTVRSAVEGADAVEVSDAVGPPASDGERGSALVEFLGVTVLLLVPLVYLVLTLVQLQAAAFAAEGAARDTGRILATGGGPERVGDLAAHNVELAFADHGFEVDGASALQVQCEASCAPGEQVLVMVTTSVPLPFLPDGVTALPVHAESRSTIDTFRELP